MNSPIRWFDLPNACMGALIMGGLVGYVNGDHGAGPATIAALKQGAYTFFVAGFVIQFCKWLAARPVAPVLAILMGVMIPTVLTVTMVYTLHSLRGTPEPVNSTVVVVVLSLVSFSYFSIRTIRGDFDEAT